MKKIWNATKDNVQIAGAGSRRCKKMEFQQPKQHGKRLKENLVRVQTLSSGQKHVTIPAPLARAANIDRGDVVEWRICKSTGKLELTVLKNYVPPTEEVKQTNESSIVHSSEHGQASQ